MPRDYQLYLDDIKLSCEKILRYTENMTHEQFFYDEKTYDAVLRNLLVIGEAAKNLPDNIKSEFIHVEWRKISGFRDIIAHTYFGIDKSILWDIIQSKVPELLKAIQE